MPNDRIAEPAARTTSIPVPDQLQQSSRAEAHRRQEPRSAQPKGHETPTSGILHELKTERAHD